jgi:hypothetical protein
LFTPTEVNNAISNCKNYKAPGFDLITAEVLKKVPRKALSPCQPSSPIQLFTPTEVKNAISNCKNYKAPGFDLITAEVLKKVPRKALVLLTYIYNSTLRTKHFPLTWKFGQIIKVLKPGKPPNDVRSYRPITLLPLMAEVFERLL